jgi:NAD(P)-dependent dehydrogenase (short-subunit alcohol dehydrogenase family)
LLIDWGSRRPGGACSLSRHQARRDRSDAQREYAARGIRINAVCPGTIDTPMVSKMLDKGMLAMDDLLRDLPMKRLGKGEEIADAVLWLCSPGSTFVTGQALAVDGGFTVQ